MASSLIGGREPEALAEISETGSMMSTVARRTFSRHIDARRSAPAALRSARARLLMS